MHAANVFFGWLVIVRQSAKPVSLAKSVENQMRSKRALEWSWDKSLKNWITSIAYIAIKRTIQEKFLETVK